MLHVRGTDVLRIMICCVAALITLPIIVVEEAVAQVKTAGVLPDSVSPFGPISLSAEEAASVQMPDIHGPVTAADEATFDKYFYFRRDDTDLLTAFADISECDGYARGLSSGLSYQQPVYPYAGTMAGAVGGALGNAFADLIAGSAMRRQMRRINMRTCMGFKGYERHGLPKALWEKFNFEEGLNSVAEAERRKLLLQQALVAVRASANGKVLEQ